MTLQRRVLLMLLLSAPLVWAGALLFSLNHTRHEINELFDTELIRLARQLQATLPRAALDTPGAPIVADDSVVATGDAALQELAVAIWGRDGRLRLVDNDGVLLPHRPEAAGFSDVPLDGALWRVYYLPVGSGEWLIAVGQLLEERDELVWSLIAGQLLPWALTLPLLLLVMAGAVRKALRPLHTLTGEIAARAPDELRPLPAEGVPGDLLPLVQAMNALLARIERTLERERRFTADAAHELRTPLAAMQAQWDAARLGAALPAVPAVDKVGDGLARLSRLVTQLLALSRLDDPGALGPPQRIDWQALAATVLDELLPLADRRHVELAVESAPGLPGPLPLAGDAALLGALLRNLLDNALRHAPAGSTVTLRLGSEQLEVLDEGPGVPPEHLPRLGDRFFRPAGEAEPGSGLGLSIVQRIAALHGLDVRWANREDRSGFIVCVTRAAAEG